LEQTPPPPPTTTKKKKRRKKIKPETKKDTPKATPREQTPLKALATTTFVDAQSVVMMLSCCLFVV